jgi:hypothetical protein
LPVERKSTLAGLQDIRTGGDEPPDEHTGGRLFVLDVRGGGLAGLVSSEAVREGAAAFAERRAPVWHGR